MGLCRRKLGGKGRAGLSDSGILFLDIGILVEPPKKKITYVRVDFFMAKAREPRTNTWHQNPSPWQ